MFPKREDCIGDLGWGYPLLREIFSELGRRSGTGRSHPSADDIILVGGQGVKKTLTVSLERGGEYVQPCQTGEQRKVIWQRYAAATPATGTARKVPPGQADDA